MIVSKKIKKVKIGQKKVVIVFDDLDKLEISPNVYTEYNLFPNKCLSKRDIDEIKSRNDIDKYNSYATKLLSNKQYSTSSIKDKLSKKGANEAQIEEVIKLLIKYQLLDDSLLVKEYLEYADYKHFGYNRIREDLIKKGIPIYKIDKIKYDEKRELKLAKEILKDLEKKYSKYNHFQIKKHCYDALIRLGYGFDIAKVVVENISPMNKKKEMELLKIDYQKAKAKYEKKYHGYELTEKINNSLLQKGYKYEHIKEIR